MNAVFRYQRYNSISKYKILDKTTVGSRGWNEIAVRCDCSAQSIVKKPLCLIKIYRNEE